MSRFFAPKENVKGKYIYVEGREARHILDVMRLGEGDKVVVFDGTGKEYVGFIKQAKPKSLTVEIIETKLPPTESLPEITLAQAIPKREKMDYIVEKATELGVKSIIPILSERVSVKLDKSKAGERSKRWQRIALEASKQCGRSDVPEVKELNYFHDIVYSLDKYDVVLFACLSDETTPLKDAISEIEKGKIVVFIGPEGDFTPKEIEMAKNAGSKFINLGKRILKSDTAGLYVISVLNYELSA